MNERAQQPARTADPQLRRPARRSASCERRSTTRCARAWRAAPRRRHARHERRHRRARHARLPVPPPSRAGRGVRDPRRARRTLRVAGEMLEIKAGRRRLPARRARLPAPDRQHLGRAASGTSRSAPRRGPRSSSTRIRQAPRPTGAEGRRASRGWPRLDEDLDYWQGEPEAGPGRDGGARASPPEARAARAARRRLSRR